MLRTVRCLPVLLLLCLPPLPAVAEVTVPVVETAQPAKVGGDRVRGAQLKRLKFTALPNSSVGETSIHANCSDAKPVYLDRKLGSEIAAAFNYALARNLREYGYLHNPGDDSVFAESTRKPAEIELGVLVQELRLVHCRAAEGGIRGSVYLRSRWELLVPAAQKVVYTADIEASINQQRHPTPVELYRAAGDALARNLLANDGVKAWLGGEEPLPPALPAAARASTVRLEAVAPPAGGILGDATLLRASVLTIEGGGRSGSGFVVSRQGYVLTNQHVVGSNRFVKLRLASGREVVGEVVQQDAARDVALIKTESGLDPLALRNGDLVPGDTVYAIGSPLGEKFSGSLTRGIVSAYRVRNGQRLIQSDVAILSGSSGGPLLDEQGRVVGLAQSGVEAGRARINLFVPIADGLRALGVALPE